MGKLLSIIVPVYNVEKFLTGCLDSILTQDYQNYECIVVDDGSTDGSGAICDTYQNKDHRMKVIHQQNGGLSAARNTAMKVAMGELIAFVDSDDRIAPNMFNRMIELMEENGADVVMCAYQSTRGSTASLEDGGIQVFSGHQFTEKILKDEIGSQLWKFVYKKYLWDGIISPERRHAQDMWILHKVTDRAERVVATDEQLYLYNDIRENNISNNRKNIVKNKVDRALAFWGRMDFCLQNNYDETVISNVINQALTFMINAFFDSQIFEERFSKDVLTMRHYVKQYKKEIKKYCTRKDYRLRSLWICKSPKTYVAVYKLTHRKNEK